MIIAYFIPSNNEYGVDYHIEDRTLDTDPEKSPLDIKAFLEYDILRVSNPLFIHQLGRLSGMDSLDGKLLNPSGSIAFTTGPWERPTAGGEFDPSIYGEYSNEVLEYLEILTQAKGLSGILAEPFSELYEDTFVDLGYTQSGIVGMLSDDSISLMWKKL